MSPPLHPLLISQLSPGQYDGHNHTLSVLSEYEGVEVMNLVWEDFWSDDDFYDHNHLDRHGRDTLCVNIAPQISEIFGGLTLDFTTPGYYYWFLPLAMALYFFALRGKGTNGLSYWLR